MRCHVEGVLAADVEATIVHIDELAVWRCPATVLQRLLRVAASEREDNLPAGAAWANCAGPKPPRIAATGGRRGEGEAAARSVSLEGLQAPDLVVRSHPLEICWRHVRPRRVGQRALRHRSCCCRWTC